ncbi:DUF4865 family protein [Streptomyces sp. B-S-A8]|uniref:DUF4865 family protein n=1 Tax=Streptomyces solicavernae TaxID=3043614 RepID=A0ABT6RX65_9ACTN|nr:DUF4865 family protein [Streptomyces sp. B-S-A8]MDI3389037.1 DUF4865 family protein [Streptomyces sp. B-S-A8]
MHAMQYEITLPAGYDMGVIHERVKARGHLLDELPGLGFKAYLVRERGRDGSPVNQYAPFYLWSDSAAMAAFLAGPGFRGLCADFGRPTVRHGNGHLYVEGRAAGEGARSAVRLRERLPADADVAEAVGAASDSARQTAARNGAVCAAVVLDPHHWELTQFSLWSGQPPAGLGGEVYRVLHLSAPERAALPR